MSKIEGKGAFSEFWQKRKEHVVGDGVDGKGKTAEEINHIHAASIFPLPVFSLFRYFPFLGIFPFPVFSLFYPVFSLFSIFPFPVFSLFQCFPFSSVFPFPVFSLFQYFLFSSIFCFQYFPLSSIFSFPSRLISKILT